ncbi:hypothetical protein BJY52DRAFT_1230037 [Lactarius psammicola]|nr:hypothetical protein BJY52DRAFT_1230037 [Lactarius psammicola]
MDNASGAKTRLRLCKYDWTVVQYIPESHEDSVYLAKLTEQAEHYEEMVENMKHITSSDQELTVEEYMQDSDKPADKKEGTEAAADDLQMLGTHLPVMAFI